MNEETNTQTPAAEAGSEKKSDKKLFKLDWESMDIRLKAGRFVHTLRRPDAELILERDKEIELEIPIAKDGSYSLPDPTETEDIDARYYEKIMVEATGYNGSIPTQHKAAAFQGLYAREIYVDEDCDVFADEILVHEEIGSGDDPDFTIDHIMAQPEESDLRKLRRKLNGGRLVPGKRGRQNFVRSSGIRSAMDYYRKWIKRIVGATVAGETFSESNREVFLSTVDPLVQLRVITTMVEELTGKLLD